MTEHIAHLTTAVETLFAAATRVIGAIVGGAAFFLGIGMWLALLWFCLLRELGRHVRWQHHEWRMRHSSRPT